MIRKGIYIPAGPNPPHSVSSEVHAFWWYQFSYLVMRKDGGWVDDCNDVLKLQLGNTLYGLSCLSTCQVFLSISIVTF